MSPHCATVFSGTLEASLQFLGRNPPLVARSPGTRGGGFLSRKSQNLKIFRLRRAFLINFEYSLLPETCIFVISSCAKTCFPDSPGVFSSVRARLYHSQALQAVQTCSWSFLEYKNAPLPFTKNSPRRYDFYFHGRRNARLPFAKTLAYLQIAQKMWFLLFPRVHGRVSTIRKNNRVCTGCVNVVSDVSAGIRTPICHL